MYAVKDNRISLMERMMELGCDLTTVNKVPKLDSFSFFFFLVFFLFLSNLTVYTSACSVCTPAVALLLTIHVNR